MPSTPDVYLSAFSDNAGTLAKIAVDGGSIISYDENGQKKPNRRR